MPVFAYKAKTVSGNYIEGTIEASNKKTVYAILRQQSAYPVEVKVKGEKKELSFGEKTIDDRSLAFFCQQFSSIIRAGIPYVKCIDILRNQTNNKTLKNALNNMYSDIQAGTSISDSMEAMGKTFPEVVIQMVRAGEASGTLESVMERLGTTFENRYKLSQKLKSSMIYPIVVGSLAIIICIGLLVFVLPTFASVFESAEAQLPLITRILLALSNYLTEYGLIALVALVILVVLYKSYTSKGEARVNRDKNRTIGKGIIKKLRLETVTASFCRTLSSLLAAGVAFTDSLVITSRTLDNAYAERIVLGIEEQVRRGLSLASMIKEADYFPDMVYHLVGVGEESGTVDEMLLKAADFFENEVNNTVARLTSIFEPMMIIVLGAVIAILVLGIVTPMFDMVSYAGAGM